MNPLRSALLKTRLPARTLVASGSILGAARMNTPMMQSRFYTAEAKKSGSSGLKWLSK